MSLLHISTKEDEVRWRTREERSYDLLPHVLCNAETPNDDVINFSGAHFWVNDDTTRVCDACILLWFAEQGEDSE